MAAPAANGPVAQHDRSVAPSPAVAAGRRRGLRFALLVLVAAFVASLRFLTITFNDDHFVHLTAAQQMRFGDWPTRDFIDIGRPLQILVSAAGQWWLGDTLFADAIVVSAGFGIAAAFTAALVFTLTGSPILALSAVLIETAGFPRTYAYPKLLATALGLWLIGSFLRHPGPRRQFLMAVGTVVAFLFRHDLGLFVAIGSVFAVVVAAPAESTRTPWRRAMMFAGMTLALAAPYLAYVELNGGLWNYFATALQQNSTEPGYVWPNPLVMSEAWESQLLYLFHAVPLVALAIGVMMWRRGRADWSVRCVTCIAVVGIAENFGLIRHTLYVRMPDAIVPVVVLGSWMTYRAWRSRVPYLGVPAAVLFVLAGIAVAELGAVRENLNRADLTTEVLWRPALIASRFGERSAVLHDRLGDVYSRYVDPLRPFLSYLERCTTEQHRLFLGGRMPEVPYIARRPFAGGGYEDYNFSSPVNQQRVVDRLRRQLAPIAVIRGGMRKLDTDLPILAAYLHNRYVPLADVPVPGDSSIHLMVDRTLPSTSWDPETGWPCFTNTPPPSPHAP